MTLEDGTKLSPALGIGAFVDKTLVAAGQCTKVDPNAPAAVAGLLGCGVMAGLGAALNTGSISRGDSVAVIGCGGVGNAAIAGARLAGARTIIAIDVDPRKLTWASRLGATDTVDATERDPVEAIQELTGGFGADVVIDAVGRPETWKQAFYGRDLAGTVVLVGVPTPEMKLNLPLLTSSAGRVVEVVGTATAHPPVTSRCQRPTAEAAPRSDAFVSETITSTMSSTLKTMQAMTSLRPVVVMCASMSERVQVRNERPMSACAKRQSDEGAIQRVSPGDVLPDGGNLNVENNVWPTGDDESVLVIDAAHDRAHHPGVIGHRRVVARLHPRARRPRHAAPALGLHPPGRRSAASGRPAAVEGVAARRCAPRPDRRGTAADGRGDPRGAAHARPHRSVCFYPMAGKTHLRRRHLSAAARRPDVPI
jgi:hypothetical protein